MTPADRPEIEWSAELLLVEQESRTIATTLGMAHTTAHLFICLFTVDNQAKSLLSDHALSLDSVLPRLSNIPPEPPMEYARVLNRAAEIARSVHSDVVSTLHLLVAMASFTTTSAYQLMEQLDLEVMGLRNAAFARIIQPVPAQPVASVAAPAAPRAYAVVGSAAPLGARRPLVMQPPEPPVVLQEDEDEDEEDDDTEPEEDDAEERAGEEPEAEPPVTRRTGPIAVNSAADEPTDTGRLLALRLAQRQQQQRPEPPRSHGTLPALPPMALPPTVNRSQPKRTTAPLSMEGRAARQKLILRESQFPLLARIGRNLSLMAVDGQIDRVVGRDKEIDALADILNKRRGNNPLLIGDPGVGKTAVVEGLARRIAGLDDEPAPRGLEGRIVVEVEASKLLSGTGLRGAFSERIGKLKAEVAAGAGQLIVFLDEIHQWIGMGGGGDGSNDGAGELKTALARGEFSCIGATSFEEYRRFIEADAAFARRFQAVRVEEPSVQAAIDILHGAKDYYASHHEVTYSDEAIELAVRLSHRFIQDRRLPDKALNVLDLAGSQTRRRREAEVGKAAITAVVAEQAGLSADKLLMADKEKMLNLESLLGDRVIGHRDLVARVAQILRRNYAGFVSNRPVGSLLLLGPTGVGKTELAKALAGLLFESEQSLVRFDMSEMMESHAVSRLIGSPPGYVGHDQGGQLTEAIRRRPYQLVLFDEIEKAHTDVLNLLIQILDEGRLSDSRGRTVDFSSALIVMTSNLGAKELTGANDRRVGFAGTEVPSEKELDRRRERVITAARAHFTPEIWARIDEPLVFFPLSEEEIGRIAELQLRASSSQLQRERRIRYTWDASLIAHLIASGGYDPQLGARPMRRTIERLVEGPISELILTGSVDAGGEVVITVADGKVVVSPRS